MKRKEMKMIEKINTTDGNYGVEFIENGDSIMAVAVMNDGESYGGSSYWFTIGTYKSMKTAIRWAIKKMAAHNKELNVA